VLTVSIHVLCIFDVYQHPQGIGFVNSDR